MPIQAVTLAISELLAAALHEQVDVPQNSFDVFVGPPDADKDQDELILFLMRITPNADLRNADRVRRSIDPRVPPERFDAVPLDLHYLVTPGSPANTNAADGLRRLGLAIRAIEAASPLSLPDYHQDAVWLSLNPMSSEELGRIWGLFNNFNCRTCFTFCASPVWIDGRAPIGRGAPVIERTLRAGTPAGVAG